MVIRTWHNKLVEPSYIYKMFTITTIGLQIYLLQKQGKLIQIIIKHENKKKMFSVFKKADKYKQ